MRGVCPRLPEKSLRYSAPAGPLSDGVSNRRDPPPSANTLLSIAGIEKPPGLSFATLTASLADREIHAIEPQINPRRSISVFRALSLWSQVAFWISLKLSNGKQ